MTFSPLQHVNLNLRAANSTRLPHPHILPGRAFHHWSIWSYLALAFVILAMTTVFAYMIYSCYHSAKRTDDSVLAATEAGTVDWDEVGGRPNSLRISSVSGASKIGRMNVLAGEVGEKVKIRSAKVGSVFEMKGFGHERKLSDEHRIMQSSLANAESESSLAYVRNSSSFEIYNEGLSLPPLAYAFDAPPTYIPFHLPPPPQSPTPAHKQYVERQKQRNRAQRSPASPSPSFDPSFSPPPITPRLGSPALQSDMATWSGKTAIESEHSNTKANVRTGLGIGLRREPEVEFDENNIRFVPPLNLFMTPSTVMLWNDPKLSPIHGSIISPTSPTTPDKTFVSTKVLTASPSMSPKWQTKSTSAHDKEIIRPVFSRPVFYKRGRSKTDAGEERSVPARF